MDMIVIQNVAVSDTEMLKNIINCFGSKANEIFRVTKNIYKHFLCEFDSNEKKENCLSMLIEAGYHCLSIENWTILYTNSDENSIMNLLDKSELFEVFIYNEKDRKLVGIADEKLANRIAQDLKCEEIIKDAKFSDMFQKYMSDEDIISALLNDNCGQKCQKYVFNESSPCIGLPPGLLDPSEEINKLSKGALLRQYSLFLQNKDESKSDCVQNLYLAQRPVNEVNRPRGCKALTTGHLEMSRGSVGRVLPLLENSPSSSGGAGLLGDSPKGHFVKPLITDEIFLQRRDTYDTFQRGNSITGMDGPPGYFSSRGGKSMMTLGGYIAATAPQGGLGTPGGAPPVDRSLLRDYPFSCESTPSSTTSTGGYMITKTESSAAIMQSKPIKRGILGSPPPDKRTSLQPVKTSLLVEPVKYSISRRQTTGALKEHPEDERENLKTFSETPHAPPGFQRGGSYNRCSQQIGFQGNGYRGNGFARNGFARNSFVNNTNRNNSFIGNSPETVSGISSKNSTRGGSFETLPQVIPGQSST
eukprot:GHVL01008071.1.p1 GENE.GHVL01008071.1~~GHVL01008071.1.p1  ORF type:complete len:530 (+),score=119.11 GHVL01008071.1:36-1625(+)